jgi:iron complex transport system substrate-binding protein
VVRRPLLFLLMLVLAWLVSTCGLAPASPSAPAIAASPTVASTAVAVQPPLPSAPIPATAAPTPLAITDVAGRKVTFARVPQRIISLAPSNTEILFVLDLGPKVIGVDDFSDFPAEAQALPKVGGLNANYNFEQIVALKPDLILAAGITPPEVIKKLEDLGLAVVVIGTANTTFPSILSDITLVGQITNRETEAGRVISDMQRKLEQVEGTLAPATTKPRVYWELDATDVAKPFTVGPGNFVNDLIALAGGVNVFETANSPYPQVSAEQVVAANPEVILLADAAYGITVRSVLERPGWDIITAVQQKRVYPIDANLVSRPGPRIVEGLEVVARLIHPELFQ